MVDRKVESEAQIPFGFTRKFYKMFLFFKNRRFELRRKCDKYIYIYIYIYNFIRDSGSIYIGESVKFYILLFHVHLCLGCMRQRNKFY